MSSCDAYNGERAQIFAVLVKDRWTLIFVSVPPSFFFFNQFSFIKCLPVTLIKITSVASNIS